MSAKEQIKQLVDYFKRERYLKDKTDGMAEGLLLGAQLADEANERSKAAEDTTKRTEEKYKEQILAQDLNPNKDPELVDLRNGNTTAGERITKFEQETTAQLAQNELKVNTLNNEKADNKRIDDIIATPTSISEQEIIDARQGEVSLGANISKVNNALDFILVNEIENGDFSMGLDGWYINDKDIEFEDGTFKFISAAASPAVSVINKNFIKDHVYYFFLDVENNFEDVQFQIYSGSPSTFGVINSLNSIKGSGILKSVIPAKENSNGFRIYARRQDLNIKSTFKINRIFAIDLTKAFGVGNEPDRNAMNKLLRHTGLFNGKKIVSQKGMLNFYGLEKVPELINDTENKLVKVKYGRNLFNSAFSELGEPSDESIKGRLLQIVNLDRDLISQKIDIGNSENVIFRGIRAYVIVDKFNYVVKPTEWVPIENTIHLSSNEIPSDARYIWVVTYRDNRTLPQFEIGTELSAYKPYGIEGLYVGDVKISDYPLIGGAAPDFFNEKLYQFSQVKLNQSKLMELNGFLTANAKASMLLQKNKENTQVELLLKKPGKQKLILHLHKRENDGYDTNNDVYLPNVNDDFSDVRITSDTGEVLSYRKIYYANDFDVVADSRLGIQSRSKTLVNSRGIIIKSIDGEISTSENNGFTWTPIANMKNVNSPTLNLITSDDTIYFNRLGILYRSEYPYTNYKEVLDTRVDYTGTFIHVNSMIQHPDGEILAGAYQNEWHIRIYKSIDNGLTWEICFEDLENYQHVHSMYIDTSVNPVAIYAGTDGGGGVIKTSDKGVTWKDLRANSANMPQATDFGVIYADPSGYRLLGGETSIVGGYSIIKTEDDINFKPVLGNGSGVANARKLDGLLFAGGAGKNSFKNAILYMSRDNGETWKSVYTTGAINDTDGANDGFRYLSNVQDQIFVSTQSDSRSPLRILPDGKYAEIVVDIPAGSEKIIIQDGHFYPNNQPITNDTTVEGEVLVKFDLNENGTVVKESVSGELYKNDYGWEDGGKQLINFYPPIVGATSNKSLSTKNLEGFDANSFDASQGFTISFWGRLQNDHRIELIRTSSDDVLNLNNYQLNINGGNVVAYKFPVVSGVTEKTDIVFYPDGSVKTYSNGQLRITSRDNVNYLPFLSSVADSDKLTMLRTVIHEEGNFIQEFVIRKGTINAEQLYEEYNSYLRDNMGG